LNESARSFAKELDVIRPAAGERIANPIEALLFNALGQENVAGDDAALTALSGSGLAAMPSVVMNTFNALGDAVAVRQELSALGGVAAQSGLTPNIVFAYAGGGGLSVNAAPGEIVADASSPPSAPWLPAHGSGFNTWGEAVGNWSSVGSRNGNPGFSGNLGGFVIGADRDLGNLLAGGAFGYARAAAAASALTRTSSTYAGSGYVTYCPALLSSIFAPFWVRQRRPPAAPLRFQDSLRTRLVRSTVGDSSQRATPGTGSPSDA
jgi:uncharacterized protein with beta-barrel porin domain